MSLDLSFIKPVNIFLDLWIQKLECWYDENAAEMKRNDFWLGELFVSEDGLKCLIYYEYI